MRDSGSEHRKDFVEFVTIILRHSGWEAECCEGSIPVTELEDAFSNGGGEKSSGLEGLPSNIYIRMPDLLGRLQACV